MRGRLLNVCQAVGPSWGAAAPSTPPPPSGISYANVHNYYGPYAYCSLDKGVAYTNGGGPGTLSYASLECPEHVFYDAEGGLGVFRFLNRHPIAQNIPKSGLYPYTTIQ